MEDDCWRAGRLGLEVSSLILKREPERFKHLGVWKRSEVRDSVIMLPKGFHLIARWVPVFRRFPADSGRGYPWFLWSFENEIGGFWYSKGGSFGFRWRCRAIFVHYSREYVAKAIEEARMAGIEIGKKEKWREFREWLEQ
jgi:hypothetical protein